jgi:hypothetical protein
VSTFAGGVDFGVLGAGAEGEGAGASDEDVGVGVGEGLSDVDGAGEELVPGAVDPEVVGEGGFANESPGFAGFPPRSA